MSPSTISVASGHALLLYDGVCGFCNHFVQWVIRHDRRDRFRFAPQQSALAAAILERHGIDADAALGSNSVYLVLNAGAADEVLLTRSDVSVNILLVLGGALSVAGWLFRLVPRPLRDAAYNLFARNRYRISRRYQSCPLPSPAVREKFLA
jgi:predicted DCC family thiol-disulfide oxidoreductase YuxK